MGIRVFNEAALEEAYKDGLARASLACLELAVEELKGFGWKREDFARALRDMLEE